MAKQVVILGGPGTGTSELSREIASLRPEANYFYSSHYFVQLPMTLMKTDYNNLLDMEEREFLETLIEERETELLNFEEEGVLRKDFDDLALNIMRAYGDHVFGKVALKLTSGRNINIYDGMGNFKSLEYFQKQAGGEVVSVGLYCDLEERQKRLRERGKWMDENQDIKELINRTDELLEIDDCFEIVSYKLNTTCSGVDSLARRVVSYLSGTNK